MYAIFETGGKQYKVFPGDIITVEKIKSVSDKRVEFDHVLLVQSDDNLQIGKPFVTDAKIFAEIIKDGRGPKIRVSKFKAKVRYRRTTGHRQSLTSVKILSIGQKPKTESKKEAKEIKQKSEQKAKPARKSAQKSE